MELVVSEVFGPTVQGEGPSTGMRANFLRLAMCNLKCVWCDTPYTWDWKGESNAALFGYGPDERAHGPYVKADEVRLASVQSVAHELVELAPAPLLVITGGEPLLQKRTLHYFLNYLSHYAPWYKTIEFETNGTVSPGTLKHIHNVWFNVSPKLAGSGNSLEKRRDMNVLAEFAALPRARFKFVVEDDNDLAECVALAAALGIDHSRVWLMPQGVDPDTILMGMADMKQSVLNLGFNLSTRLHVLLWGNERGR